MRLSSSIPTIVGNFSEQFHAFVFDSAIVNQYAMSSSLVLTIYYHTKHREQISR